MSTATLNHLRRPPPRAQRPVDFSRPVVRPRPASQTAGRGGARRAGLLQLPLRISATPSAIFCGFAVDRFDPKKRTASRCRTREFIDICVKNHIGYLLFVGGEPLVHRDLRAMTPTPPNAECIRGLHQRLALDGANMRELASDGLSSVIISIDSHECREARKKIAAYPRSAAKSTR